MDSSNNNSNGPPDNTLGGFPPLGQTSPPQPIPPNQTMPPIPSNPTQPAAPIADPPQPLSWSPPPSQPISSNPNAISNNPSSTPLSDGGPVGSNPTVSPWNQPVATAAAQDLGPAAVGNEALSGLDNPSPLPDQPPSTSQTPQDQTSLVPPNLETQAPTVPGQIDPLAPPSTPTGNQPMPTFTAPISAGTTNQADHPIDPLSMQPATPFPSTNTPPSSISQIPETPPSLGSEPAPTDLSHLAANSTEQTQQPVYTPPVNENANLVPQQPVSTPETIKPKGIGSIMPKLFIVVGVLIVLLVAGASAYFILGVGRGGNGAETTSAPAIESEETLTTPPVLQQPSPTPSTEATSSAGFGSITPGGSASPSPTASGSSAIDLLRQRQAASPKP